MDMKKVKYISAGVVVLLLGIVIFQNFEEVTVNILMATVRMPLALMLLLTFVVGMVAGWILSLVSGKKKIVDKK
ncbi:hypothetical protein NT6N_16820 [Oceaniferula spumae]|uniref:Lipopolysaccharide assembly protein A domain-containing protein n=1 Tax=Oceaniferula spumae TaxID=2979115 RepID=A0AAT9FL09_9BACT